MQRAMIVGVGMTVFGRHPGTHYTDLAVDAIEEALEDANMDFREVQQAFCSRVYLPSATMGNQIALSILGRPGDELIVEESAHIGKVVLAVR